MSANKAPAVLTIAGFDPSGGAGIIADVRTIQDFGCRPVAAITSLTFQNSEGVFGSVHLTAASVRAQILPVLEETEIAAVKTGMLPTTEIVAALAQLIRENKLPAPVVDPVMRSSSGYELTEQGAMKVLVDELMPLARLITPNIPEAERLTGLHIEDEEGMRRAACKLRELGARAVLIKGGHLPRKKSEVRSQKSEETEQALDLLDDRGEVRFFCGDWIDAPNVRGTGCMLSSAIATGLARGESLEKSVRLARDYVRIAIRQFASVPRNDGDLSEQMKNVK